MKKTGRRKGKKAQAESLSSSWSFKKIFIKMIGLFFFLVGAFIILVNFFNINGFATSESARDEISIIGVVLEIVGITLMLIRTQLFVKMFGVR